MYRPYYNPETFEWPDASTVNVTQDLFEDVQSTWVTEVGMSVARFYAQMLVSQPFEVTKLLLQVCDLDAPKYKSSTFDDDDIDDDEDVDYFIDLSGQNKRLKAPIRRPVATSTALTLNSPPRRSYPNAIEPDSFGVFSMISLVSGAQGALGLWRGINASCLLKAAHGLTQTWLSNVFLSSLSMPDLHLELGDPRLFICASTAACCIASYLLTPLAIIRTRLVVTTYNSQPRSLRRLLLSLFTFPASLSVALPTVLAAATSHLVEVAVPVLLLKYFGVDEFGTPVLYSLAKLGSRMVELVLRLPLDTLAHRAQASAAQIESKDMYLIAPKPYPGFFKSLWEVLSGREKLSSLYHGGRAEVLARVGEWGYATLDQSSPDKEQF